MCVCARARSETETRRRLQLCFMAWKTGRPLAQIDTKRARGARYIDAT